MSINVIFLGDVIGRAGRKLLKKHLSALKYRYGADIVIANGENAAGGFGINEKVYKELRNAGVDVITSGNHIWDKKDAVRFFDKWESLIRPANYPQGVPGTGFLVVEIGNVKVAVINLLGRVFMGLSDCPFRKFDEIYERVKEHIIIVDFHAEATSEKGAFAFYVDGRATAVVGTHTHVQTNDDRILPSGTLFISDVGMCGSLDSVIGMEADGPIKRFLTGIPHKFEVEKKGKMVLNGLFFSIDRDTKRVKQFEKICEVVEG